MLRKDDILSVQINSVLLTLINFHKFIAGDEKWVLYVSYYDNSKKRKSWLWSISTSTAKPNSRKKSFGVQK